jgi:mannitol-1-phosphate/altronate dehydrogenase
MNRDEIKVNNHTYSVALNEQTQMYTRKLRGLYQQDYSDVDSFDEISSEISNTVNNLLKRSVSPEVREEDMDGVIQHLLKGVDKAKKKLA